MGIPAQSRHFLLVSYFGCVHCLLLAFEVLAWQSPKHISIVKHRRLRSRAVIIATTPLVCLTRK